MTRDEALNILRKPRDGMNYTESLLVCLVELGVLKLDEPKREMDAFCGELRKLGYRGCHVEKDMAVALGRSGLKIVEK